MNGPQSLRVPPAVPRDSGPRRGEDHLRRIASIHPDRLYGEFRAAGGIPAVVRHFLSYHPERRHCILRSIRERETPGQQVG